MSKQFGVSSKTISRALTVLEDKKLIVTDPNGLMNNLPKEEQNVIVSILEQDPRPSYHNDPERVYAFEKSGFRIRFSTDGKILSVVELIKLL